MKVNAGNDAQAWQMGALSGDTGTGATVTYAATTVTDTGKAWTTNQWAGHLVSSGAVYGVAASNTATVITVDRWYNPATPGGAAGTTPSANATYQIAPGNAPVGFTALTANTTAEATTDTALTGEITTAGGGLIRKPATFGHTTGAASFTFTTTFTANGSDALPVTVGKVGQFNSLTAGNMQFEKLLTSTAQYNAVGDQTTFTHTIST